MAGKPIDNLSIIVSANTNPLAQDLQRAAREVDAFGKKVSRAQRDADRYASQVPRGAVAGATRGINALMINRGITRDMIRDGTLRDLTQFGRPTFAGRAGGAIWGGAGAAAAFGGRLAGGAITRTASAASSAAGSMLDFAKSIPPIAAGVAAAEVGLNGLAAGFQKVRESVQMAGELEQTRLAFEVMLGSAERANRLMADMRRFAASTPFALNEITGATRMLTAYGVAADQLMPTVRMLGDVSAAFGRELPIRDLTYLYGTLYAQQRAYAIDIRQFAGRGIPIYEELAKVLGKTNAEVKQLIEDGRVSSREVTQAFVNMTSAGGRFYGLTERQGKTFLGQWEQMADAYRLVQAQFGQALIEELGLAEATRDLSAFSQRLSATAEEMRPAIRFTGDLTRAAVQLGYEFTRAGAAAAGMNLRAYLDGFPGLRQAADAVERLVANAKDFKLDEKDVINAGFALGMTLADGAAEAGKTVGAYGESMARLFEMVVRSSREARDFIKETAEWLDRINSAASASNKFLAGPIATVVAPLVGEALAARQQDAALAGRRPGDPVDHWRLAPAFPGMSPDRVREEYAALSHNITRRQDDVAHLATLVQFGRGDLAERLAGARQELANAHRARGEYVLRSFEGDPAELTRQLDRGNVPPLRRPGAPGAPDTLTQVERDLVGVRGWFGQLRSADTAGLRASLEARRVELLAGVDSRRAARALEANNRAAYGAALGPAGLFPPQSLPSDYVALWAGVGPAAMARDPRNQTVVAPQHFPRLQDLSKELSREYDPREELNLYRGELDDIRRMRLLGDATNSITDLAWRKKVQEVAGRFGLGGPAQLASAVEVGSAEDARLINAWRTQQATTTDQLLNEIKEYVRRLLGLAEALPQAPPPRPVRLPGD